MKTIEELRREKIEVEKVVWDIERKIAEEQHRIQVEKQAEYTRALVELREKLANDNDMINHPKEELLWEKAYELGHSHGIKDIEFRYYDLLELAR